MASKQVLSLFVVDAFAEKAFEGNSAAVCLVPYQETLSNDVKQKIAAEMRHSETAFITAKSPEDTFQDGNSFHLQWFTPECEVRLCGHATLASAAVLFMALNNKSTVIEFETLSGILRCKHVAKNKVEIDLPAYKSVNVEGKYHDLAKAVVGSIPVQDVVYADFKNVLVRLSDTVTRKEFEAIKPKDEELLSAASDLVGVILTLKGSGLDDCKDENGNSYDFLSRYFAPWVGVSEDPVCGSAHSALAPYWAKYLNKKKFYVRQCSKRGGILSLELTEDRVYITGSAVIVIKGQINL